MIVFESLDVRRALSPLSHFMSGFARACEFPLSRDARQHAELHIANEIPECNGLDRRRANPALKLIAGSQIRGALANSGVLSCKGARQSSEEETEWI